MLFASLLIASCLISAQASVTDYIGKSDELRIFAELTKTFLNLTRGDLVTTYYGAKGFTALGETLPKILKLDSCAHMENNFKDDVSPEAAFYALSTWSLLTCAEVLGSKEPKLHKDSTVKALKVVLEKEDSTTTDLRYALECLKLVGVAVPNPAKVAQLLQARLKDDDSLQSIGQVLHAASLLGNAGEFALQHVEDVIVQADEVDGRLLQWEGGLTVTGLLLTGLLRLPGAKPLTQTQADKFATYLLTRKTVQNSKGIIALIEATVALSKSNVSPVSITFVESPQVTTEKPDLKIRISNIFGQPLKPAPQPVVAQSATRVADDVVVLSKQALSVGTDPAEYVLPLRLDPGQYRVGISAGSHSAALMVRVLGPVSLQWLEAGLGDADGSSAPRLTKLQYPGKLSSVLQADSSQHLIVRFTLTRSVHQPFLRLSAGNSEIIFVAEQDSSKVYKLDVNLASELTHSAAFELELILGDSIMSNPLRWSFGSVDVKLGLPEPKQAVVRSLRPEIRHMFRPAEKRPPQVVSMLFTALAAAPLLLLLILWLKVGINFGNFSLAALGFQVGLASIFGLFSLFWLKLDMFTTCGWLLPLGAFTFLAGHQVLSKLAKQRK